MKKFYTLMAAVATVFAMNAETATLTVDNLIGDYKSGTELAGTTIQIDSYLEVSFSNGTGTSNVAIRKSGSDNVGYIALYSGNVMTITAEGATITALNFDIDDDSDNPQTASNSTPTWSVRIDGTLYGPGRAAGVSWTGSTSTLTVNGNAKTTILGLTIDYTVDKDSYQNAYFFFDEESETTLNPKSFAMTNDETSVTFKSTSDNAGFSKATRKFGTADDYTTLAYRYMPGSSATSITSSTLGTFSFPCAGELYIYAIDTNLASRSLQMQQNNETIFNHTFSNTAPADDIYPVLKADVSKGTAYLLWPNGQVSLFGFQFVPEGNTLTGVEKVAVDFSAGNGQAFDLLGRPVSDDYKGIVIQDGKKYIRR